MVKTSPDFLAWSFFGTKLYHEWICFRNIHMVKASHCLRPSLSKLTKLFWDKSNSFLPVIVREKAPRDHLGHYGNGANCPCLVCSPNGHRSIFWKMISLPFLIKCVTFETFIGNEDIWPLVYTVYTKASITTIFGRSAFS